MRFKIKLGEFFGRGFRNKKRVMQDVYNSLLSGDTIVILRETTLTPSGSKKRVEDLCPDDFCWWDTKEASHIVYICGRKHHFIVSSGKLLSL